MNNMKTKTPLQLSRQDLIEFFTKYQSKHNNFDDFLKDLFENFLGNHEIILLESDDCINKKEHYILFSKHIGYF